MTSSDIIAYLRWSQSRLETEIPFFSLDVCDILERVKNDRS
jgi:hypothetical protein